MTEYGPLTNFAEEVGWELFNDEIDVGDGDNVGFNIEPPEGKAWIVHAIAMRIESVSDASSGDHRLWLYPHAGSDDTRRMIQIEESHDNPIRPRPRGWESSGTLSGVDSASDWYTLFPFPSDGLNFRYFNNTDATATETREYHLLRSVILL